MRKRIAIDMDEVIADFLTKILRVYKERYGEDLPKEAYWGKKVYQNSGLEPLRDELYKKGFFRDFPVIEGAQEGVKALMEHYDVFITTAAMEFRNCFEDKYDWMLEHFPFVHWKNIVFCGDKSVFNTEYMIDDHAYNLETFRGKGLLFTAPHNVNETRFTRVNNWSEVLAFFEEERKKEQ